MAELVVRLKSVRSYLASYGTAGLSIESRREAVTLAQKIMIDIEEPDDLIDRIVYQPAENALIRVAVDINLFNAVNKSPSFLTAETLASKCQVEVPLMERLLRGLAAMHAVEETGEDGYSATKISRAFGSPRGAAAAVLFGDTLHPSLNRIPNLLKATGYRDPQDPDHSFFARDAGFLHNYGVLMVSETVGRPYFLGLYPAKEQLIDGYHSKFNQSGVLFVDVGGARRKETLKFERCFPIHPGKLVLQDRKDNLKYLPATFELETMVYNIFTPQPIIGARAYFFRRLFHDWNDASVLEILRNTASAMTPGYSKLLINEIVMPRRGASSFAVNQDLLVMSLFSSAERTKQAWSSLLHAAGLSVVKTWTKEGAIESVIEAMLL